MSKGSAALREVGLSWVSEADEQPEPSMPKCTEAMIDKEDMRVEKQGMAASYRSAASRFQLNVS
jgi:hypothetical protein